MAEITINPALTSTAGGSFNVSSDGLIQGMAYPDPAVRYALNQGQLASAETVPMWGGVPVYEKAAAAPAAGDLGSTLGRATTVTGGSKPILAWSVFDQAYGMINSPQSPVQLAYGGGSINYYRAGSKARIAVKADPNLISLRGGLINASVSWDFVNSQLIPYSAPTFSAGSYDTGTGKVTLTTAAAHGLLPGDEIIVSAATGTGSYAEIDGQFTLVAGTTGSTLVYEVDTGLTMTITGATLGTGAALSVSVLEVQSNSMTVSYDAGTGFATWDRSGTVAVILV